MNFQTYEYAMRGGKRIPARPDLAFWLYLAAVWVLSFFAQHDWYFSINATQVTPEDLAMGAAEGSVIRRVALPMLAVLGIVALYSRARGRLNKPDFTGWVLLALFLWMAGSVMWSDQPELSVRRIIAFACLMISALGTAAITGSRLPTYVVVFASCNLIVGILAEMSLGSFMPGASDYRFGGTLHPNLQGANLVILILSCVWVVFSSSSRKRGLAVLALAGIAFVFLLLTQSRTSLAALVVGLAFSLAIMAARKWGSGVLIPIVAAVGAACGLLLLLDAFSPTASFAGLASRIVSTDRDLGDPTQLTGRVDLWYEVLGFIAQRPWLGWGFDAFWSPQRVLQISWTLQWQINQAHNSYLEMMVNLGVPGVALYVLAIGSTLIAFTKSFFAGSDAAGFGGAMVIFAFVHGMLESITVLPAFPSYLMFIVMFRVGYMGVIESHEGK